jgi:hypothetical protein
MLCLVVKMTDYSTWLGARQIRSFRFSTPIVFYFENTIYPANLPALVYAAQVVRTPYMTPAGPDSLNLMLNSSTVPAGTPVTF